MKRTIIDEVKDRGVKKLRINHLDSEKKIIVGTLTPIEKLKKMTVKQKNGLTLSEDDRPFIFDVTYPKSINKQKLADLM